MLQNVTSLRKSAPGSPNISDEHVSCTAPATENASCQILFKCPTPATVFGHATKPSRFAHFWPGAQSLAPATRNDIWTSKSRPTLRCFVHFDLEMCFAPQWRALFRHMFQSDPGMVCFLHFDFEMCFAPQRRALFRHCNFQKCSECEVPLAFSLANVLRATTACTFSTSQLPKALRSSGALYILTWKCALRHNGLQLFISHLTTWLRTRRFSEPTSRPSGATNHWKNTVFRDFPTFSRTWIFFLLRLSLFWSSFFFSLLWLFPSLRFICPYCQSLASKLPSINCSRFKKPRVGGWRGRPHRQPSPYRPLASLHQIWRSSWILSCPFSLRLKFYPLENGNF